ncbi:hypothetical protein JHK85_010181 [Glycine max]|nr:hypothetical protein JHK85_010181 [Glycine max]
MRPISDATNIEANGWKSKDHCNMMVKRMGLTSHIDTSSISSTLNAFGGSNIFDARAEYIARISTKMNPVREPLQSDESNLLPSKASASELSFIEMWLQTLKESFNVLICNVQPEDIDYRVTLLSKGRAFNSVIEATCLFEPMEHFTRCPECRQIEDACKMFERIPQRDSVSWNTVVVGYA